MLHDLFLYDWRKRENDRLGLHAFTHPKQALINSQKYFKLNKKEIDIILKHMWPVTPIPPRYFESLIITLTDKYCALKEFYYEYTSNKKLKNIYFKYAYLLMFISYIKLI